MRVPMRFFASYFLLLGIARVQAQCPGLSDWPSVTLPWGTVTASDCDPTNKLWIFRNVRFGKPTDGSTGGTLRFAQSAFPDSVSNPEKVHLDTSTSTVCLGITLSDGPSCASGDGDDETPPAAGPILSPPIDTNDNGSEDCLFLDVFVPWFAVNNSTFSLPVVVWFYGGAYLSGSKDAGLNAGIPLYDGRGFSEAAQQLNNSSGLIYVAGNYRLAHLGWLAGPTVLAVNDSSKAMPNAGLGDQRLLLQFVQNNIAKFGGNNSEVTVFGESAGAGSILHHLVAQDGGAPRDPLFQRAIMQSAAFQWIWDNAANGTADIAFNKFVGYTTCQNEQGSAALSCLQGLGLDDMKSALTQYWNNAKCSGVWNMGPVVDGTVITQLPAIALEASSFQFHSSVTGVISSHVQNEAKLFVPKYITDTSGFEQLLESFLINNTKNRPTQRACISSQYKILSKNSPGQIAAAKAMIQDSMFTCNVRYMYDAAQQQKPTLPLYVLDYAFFGNYVPKDDLAVHATDLLPTFWTNNQTVANAADVASIVCKAVKIAGCNFVMKTIYLPAMQKLRQAYQKYLMAFALQGDPNKSGQSPPWPVAGNGGTNLSNVLVVRRKPQFSVGLDTVATEPICKFWSCMASAVVNDDSGKECCSSSLLEDDSEAVRLKELLVQEL